MGEPKKPESADEATARDMASGQNAEQRRPARKTRSQSVRRTVIRNLLVVTLVLLATILYVLWFITGKPEPTVDYIAILNETTRPEGLTAENNAWPHYERAIQQYAPHRSALLGDGFPINRNRRFDELNEPAQKAIERWIADNEAAWQSFVRATQEPYCWKEYERSQGPASINTLDIPTLPRDMGPMAPLRGLMHLATWRICRETHMGQTAAALEDCLVLIRTGAQWSGTGSLQYSLLGVGMATTGHRQLLKVVARTPTDRIDWQKLEAGLIEAYGTSPVEVRMELEKLMALDIVQHTFTHGGIGGGHLIPRFVWPLSQMNSWVITLSPLATKASWRRRGLHLAIALAHARRNATVSECHCRYDQIEQILALTPDELARTGISFAHERPHIVNNTIRFNSFFRDTRYFAVELSMRTAKQISEQRWQSHAWHNATRAILAVKRWQKEHGQYPETLEQLTGDGSLEPPPLDPYSDTILMYRKTDDGFTLYSRGRNFKDDGGVPQVDPDTPWRTWGTQEAGDAVFWSMQ